MATITRAILSDIGPGFGQGIEVNMVDRTLAELNMRRTICQAAIKVLDRSEDDPRKPAAMENYKAQLASIDAQITELTGTPPPIVVGLKTATLFGDATMKKEGE